MTTLADTVLLATLVLAVAAGGGAIGCSFDIGTGGELGQGTFDYECSGPSDHYCDPDTLPQLSTDTCIGCLSTYENHRAPPVAVGATFAIWFEIGPTVARQVESRSGCEGPDHVGWTYALSGVSEGSTSLRVQPDGQQVENIPVEVSPADH